LAGCSHQLPEGVDEPRRRGHRGPSEHLLPARRGQKRQGQAKQAINNFEKALALDGSHRQTLEALIAVYSDLKDWKQVSAYKRQILDNVYEADERFKMLVDIGDIWADKEKNAVRARSSRRLSSSSRRTTCFCTSSSASTRAPRIGRR